MEVVRRTMKRIFDRQPFRKPGPGHPRPDRWADGRPRPDEQPDTGLLSRVYPLNRMICEKTGPLAYESRDLDPLFARIPGGDVCFFDCDEPFHNHIDACWQVLRPHSDMFRSKTLMLHTRFGLRGAVKQIAGLFRDVFCFYELWGTADEYQEIVNRFDAEHLTLLPVRADNRGRCRIRPRVNHPPGPGVFISLGSHTDRELAREVVRNNPDIQFYAPDRTRALPGPDGSGGGLAYSAPNLFEFESTYQAYTRWFDRCDIIFIPVLPQVCMRGGIRMADALYANKYIVTTPNDMCQTVMGIHERTCLVAGDAAGVTRALARVIQGDFRADEALYHRIRHLMLMPARMNYMAGYLFSDTRKQRSSFTENFKPRFPVNQMARTGTQ